MLKTTLKNKFILSFLPLIIIIFLFGFYGLNTFSSIQENFSNLKQDVTPGTLALMELKEVLISLDSGIDARHINREKISHDIDRLKELIRKHLLLEKHSHEPGKKTAHDMREKAIHIMSLAQYLLNLTEHGWPITEVTELHQEITKKQHELTSILDDHLALHMEDLSKSEAFISQKYDQGIIFIWVAMAVGMIVTFGMITYLLKTVISPIQVLQRGAKRIGDGDLTYHLPIDSHDEFAELGLDFEEMGRKLSESHNTLDQKVLDRTTELSKVNDHLQIEINERIQAEKEQQRAEEQVHILTQELLKIQEIERQRIALDLHDNVAQELSALKIGSETLFNRPITERNELQHRMSLWTDILKRCILTVRELSYDLRPPGIEHIGINSVIADYCLNFTKRTAIQIDYATAGMEHISLDYHVAITIYRLVQESLNNIQKHAGECLVTIKLVASFPNIILVVEDTGSGFTPDTTLNRVLSEKRLGLLGMRERVRMLNGTLKINAQLGRGTTIRIEIPWESTDEHKEEYPYH